jgi:hypothetical protein
MSARIPSAATLRAWCAFILLLGAGCSSSAKNSGDGGGAAGDGDGTAADASGGTLSWSAAVRIDNDHGFTASAPRMAVSSDGSIMAVWLQSEDDNSSPLTSRVYASLYTTVGWQAPVLLNPDIASHGPAYAPKIVADGRGSFFAVWSQASTAAEGARIGVYGKRYLPEAGWEAAVTTIDAEQVDAGMSATGALDIAADASGNATVVWTMSDETWAHMVIEAARYTSGTGWASGQIVTNEDAQSISGPAVAMDVAGNAMVVWGQATGASIAVQGVHAATYTVGSGWETPVVIEPVGISETHSGLAPQVVFDGQGDAVVVWCHHGLPGIYANRWSGVTGWGAATAIAGTSPTSADEGVQLAVDKQGNAIALWNQHNGSLLASRCAAGGDWGPTQLVDPGNADDSGRIAIGPDVTARAVWVQHVGTQSNIWANRYVPERGWGSSSREDSIIGEVSNNASDPQVVIDQSGTATVLWSQDKGLYATHITSH